MEKAEKDLSAKKVLVLKWSALGDIIIHTFSVRKLREYHPNWHITWVVDAMYADIVRMQPYVDKIIEWNRKKDGQAGFKKIIRQIKKEDYDVLVDLHSTDRSSLFALLSGIPERWCEVKKYPFTHNRVGLSKLLGGQTRAGTAKYMDSDPPSENLRTLLAERGITENTPFIVSAIGASYEKKQWPSENWAEFCRLASSGGFKICLTGAGDSEDKEANGILRLANCENVFSLVNKISIIELIQLINVSSAVVSGDTGALHIARALGVPQAALFGPSALILNDREYVGSFTRVFACDCPQIGCDNMSCEKPCMETIAAPGVYAAIKEIARKS